MPIPARKARDPPARVPLRRTNRLRASLKRSASRDSVQGESNGQTLKNMLDLFADAYPGISVVDESAGYGDYFAELAARIGSGDAPDVFELDNTNFIGFVRREAIAPLDGLAASFGADLGVYQTGLIDRICTSRDSVIALPFSYSSVVLIYNMDLFDGAGVEYPTGDWLWEDVLLAAQKNRRARSGYLGLL